MSPQGLTSDTIDMGEAVHAATGEDRVNPGRREAKSRSDLGWTSRSRKRRLMIRFFLACSGVLPGLQCGLLERSCIPCPPSSRQRPAPFRAVIGESLYIFAAIVAG
ncbi:hypothetical protein EDF61_11189 [Arthrobacter sp. JUb115]|nr:hypothetical protein EDF61_11189 [Arthrobacter sp. JUb115]